MKLCVNKHYLGIVVQGSRSSVSQNRISKHRVFTLVSARVHTYNIIQNRKLMGTFVLVNIQIYYNFHTLIEIKLRLSK